MSDFEEFHERGAEQFGLAWPWVNNEIVQTAWRYGLDPSVEPLRTALAAIAYGWCRDVARAQAQRTEEEG